MSVLNKKPFIQELIEGLSASDKSGLLDAINGKKSKVSYSLVLRNLSVSTHIESILLETNTTIYNGYKIASSDRIVFLMYGKGQEISIYDIPFPYYEKELKGKVREELTVDELRRYLEDVGETVEPAEITSEGAEKNQALVADGNDGTEWHDISVIYSVSNITSISKTILDLLKPGDIVQKITGNSKHTYIVSYKGTGAGTGICLTYTAAFYIETVSYDRSGDDWVYNSTDFCEIDSNSPLFYEKVLKSVPGYDEHKIQTLKNSGEGSFTWVDDAE